MLHPSYTDLMRVVNSDVEIGEEPVVNSRYSIVIATAKRARQIIAGDKPLVAGAAGKKPFSVAVDELYKGKVKILGEEEVAELERERELAIEMEKAAREEGIQSDLGDSQDSAQEDSENTEWEESEDSEENFSEEEETTDFMEDNVDDSEEESEEDITPED